MGIPLSIIIPAYNARQHTSRLLASILPQLEPLDEVIISDDGSSEDQLPAQNNPQIRLIRNPQNMGPASARNLGGTLAKWQGRIFVDTDVVLDPGTVREIRTRLAEAKAPVALMGLVRGSDSSQTATRLKMALLRHRHEHTSNIAFIYGSLCAFNFPVSWPAEHRILEDVRLGLDLSKRGIAIELVPSATFTHNKHLPFHRLPEYDFRIAQQYALLQMEGSLGERFHTKSSDLAGIAISWLGLATLISFPKLYPLSMAAWGLSQVRNLRLLNSRTRLSLVKAASFLYVSQISQGAGIAFGILLGIRKKILV